MKKVVLQSTLNRLLLPVSLWASLATWDLWREYKRQIQRAKHRINPERYTDADR